MSSGAFELHARSYASTQFFSTAHSYNVGGRVCCVGYRRGRRMRRDEIDGVLAYGHWGRPLLVFPSQGGTRYEWEQHGMIDAIAGLIDAGRVKVYCVDSWDSDSWHDEWLPLEERGRRHGAYEGWLLGHVAPFIYADCGGFQESISTGVSFGAYHAANLTLRRADLFPLAICMSGIYDVRTIGWGEA